MKELILTCGIPASGKSTAIKTLYPNAKVISPDNFIGYTKEDPWTGEKVKEAWNKANDTLLESFGKGEEFIVFDAMFLKPWLRIKYVNWALQYDYYVSCLYCPIPFKIALARNEERDEFRKIPIKSMIKMYDSLEEPTYEEGFFLILRA